MSAITKALTRSRAAYSIAHSSALQVKQAGGIIDLAPSGGSAQLGQFRNQAANRQRYGLFRGWVYSAVNALAMEAAGQPVQVGKLKGAESRKGGPGSVKGHILNKMTVWASTKAAHEELEIMPSHPLLDALEQPNPIQYRWQFVYSFIANLNLTGMGYIVGGEKEGGGFEFYSIPTTWVKPDHSKGAFAQFRIINPNNPQAAQDQEPLDRSQVVFASLPNPADPLSALAPAQAQHRAISIDDKIQESQDVFFDNAYLPSVIITLGKYPHPDVQGGVRPHLSPMQRRQIQGAIKKVSTGISNYGNPAIIDGMIDGIERLSATSNEMGWEKSEMAVRTRILSAFAVHPFILGESVPGSYAQAYKIEDRFCKRVNTYLDMLSTIMTSFGGELAGEGDRLLVWWEKCKAEDPALDQKLLIEARKNDDISQDELRAEMGLPPDEDRNQSVINRQALQGVSGIAAQVAGGSLTPEQGVAILEGLGLPTDMAKNIAGKALPKSEPPAEEIVEELEEVVKLLSKPVSFEFKGADQIASAVVSHAIELLGAQTKADVLAVDNSTSRSESEQEKQEQGNEKE